MNLGGQFSVIEGGQISVIVPKTGALRLRVNQQLGRDDLTSANIRVALEQIPCTVIRATVFRELAQGAFHPKEEVVLAELFAAVEQQKATVGANALRASSSHSVPALVDPVLDVQQASPGEVPPDQREAVEEAEAEAPASARLLRYAEIASKAGIEALHETPDEDLIQQRHAACVNDLLTPKLPLSRIPEPVAQMVTAMALYASGASFS